MTSFTPREIVSELDRYIVGQHDAKKAVAIALRNRWRRQQLDEDMREEVLPKNILMIGPTGVGKTEIARRLAKLTQAPFIKIEATKFTEVGYVGRDVEQIIRDLLEAAIHMSRDAMRRNVEAKAELNAENRVVDALVGEGASKETKEKFRTMLRNGEMGNKEIELELTDTSGGGMPTFDIPGMPGARSERQGADVSREGVQRDLLPLIEGTTVSTKHGPVKTDHILFIASGAFHIAKPSDMLPELQGRLPIRVNLNALTRDDFVRILTEPEASLVKQYTALMGVEDLRLDFSEDAILEIADLAAEINQGVENIGARRLHTVMEKLLEEVSYTASERGGETVHVDAAYVREKVSDLARNADVSKFIL